MGTKKLVIPVQKRSQMLLDAGYTQEEIIKRAVEVQTIQTLRQESACDAQNVQNGGFGKLFSKNFISGFNKLSLGVTSQRPVKKNSPTARVIIISVVRKSIEKSIIESWE